MKKKLKDLVKTEKKACRICKKTNIDLVIDFGNQHVSNFTKNINDAKKVDVESLKLGICKKCKTVQLFKTYSQKKMYQKYWYISGINEIMINELSTVVENAKEFISLKPGDYVLDIASNDGTLLQNYSSKINCYGVDPSDIAKKSKKYKKNIKLINRFFDEDTFKSSFKKKFKIITVIAMFYDSDDPVKFLKNLHKFLADDGIAIIQISYTPLMLKCNEFGVISHEHLCYYTFQTLKRVLNKCNFNIIDAKINENNGASIRVICTKKKLNINNSFPLNKVYIGQQNIESIENYEQKLGFNKVNYYKTFRNRINKLKLKTLKWFKKQKKLSKLIIGYGASTKGNVLLQYYGINQEYMKFIAERSKNKFNLYTPGTCIKIISEAKARKLKPDYLFVLPWFFLKSFIMREQKLLKKGTKIIVPQPQLYEISMDKKSNIVRRFI
tara:strand:- start:664 stop:1983 length:1320 start_codon:yes stop_codon:yes gene_type:complete